MNEEVVCSERQKSEQPSLWCVKLSLKQFDLTTQKTPNWCSQTPSVEKLWL